MQTNEQGQKEMMLRCDRIHGSLEAVVEIKYSM
jgi:hypothetical protein